MTIGAVLIAALAPQVGASLAAKKKAELVDAKERTTDGILYYTFTFKAVSLLHGEGHIAASLDAAPAAAVAVYRAASVVCYKPPPSSFTEPPFPHSQCRCRAARAW